MMNDGTKLRYADITEVVIGSFYDVYNELGHGFLESVYRDALGLALQSKGIHVDREKAVQVKFRGQVVGLFRTDLVVQDSVVVELKCARTIDRMHEAQLLNYLKATEFEVGLLLNFGVRPQFRRMLLDNNQKIIRVHRCQSVVD
jgi:GxxExxY protein